MVRGILNRLRPVTFLIVALAVTLESAPIAVAARANRQTAPAGPPATTTTISTVVTAGDTGPYYSMETITLSDGTQVDEVRVNGPTTPPLGYELERAPVAPSALNQPGVASSLSVPAYDWVFGCGAVSASMIGAYFDRNGFPNIYTGPTNGGVMPLDNSIWPKWTDSAGKTYPGNPLAASRLGLDGRTTRGSIDDYWVAYQSTAPDPYITGGWTQHTLGDAFGDYMKTSQSAYGNPDGATYFYWNTNGTPLTCAAMESTGSANKDATYGRKLFYEARGYSVTECYNQRTDNTIAGGFSFADYKAQIDAGHPVFIFLTGHFVVGVGYQDPSTVYLNDTWDYQTHQMTWGTSYTGLELLAAGIVNPALPTAPKPTITGLNPSSATPGSPAFTLTVNGTGFIGSSVVRWKGSDRHTTWVSGTQLTAAIPKEDIAAAGTASVTVFNPTPGGGLSNAVSFLVGALKKVHLPLVVKSLPAPVLNPIDNAGGDGNYNVSWGASTNATGYLLQEDDDNTFASPTTAYSGGSTSWNATGKAVGTYFYRVQASNTWSASGWSNTVSTVVQPAASNGINGRVTYGGADAMSIEVQLRFWNGSSWSTAARTTTDAAGRYRFFGITSLDSGQEYYVRFGPNNSNSAYLWSWWGPSITSYANGSTVPGGDFDIANVSLLSPANDSTAHLPVTLTWQQRGISADTYRVSIFDTSTRDGWLTDDLGNVGSFNMTNLPPDAVFGKAYGWDILVFNGPDSYGESYFYRRITFVSGLAQSPVLLSEWVTRDDSRELDRPAKKPQK